MCFSDKFSSWTSGSTKLWRRSSACCGTGTGGVSTPDSSQTDSRSPTRDGHPSEYLTHYKGTDKHTDPSQYLTHYKGTDKHIGSSEYLTHYKGTDKRTDPSDYLTHYKVQTNT